MSGLTDEARTRIAGLEKGTGRPYAEWRAILAGLGTDKHAEIIARLKAEHGLSHGYANLLALLHRGWGTTADDELVAELFAGSKAGLRPIYDRLVEITTGFGSDVALDPKKTMVMIRRSKGFACFTPSSAKRAELGIALRGVAPTERLRVSNGMTSHAVWIEDAGAIDDEVIAWLREAYDRA
jgi:hypothetical protein